MIGGLSCTQQTLSAESQSSSAQSWFIMCARTVKFMLKKKPKHTNSYCTLVTLRANSVWHHCGQATGMPTLIIVTKDNCRDNFPGLWSVPLSLVDHCAVFGRLMCLLTHRFITQTQLPGLQFSPAPASTHHTASVRSCLDTEILLYA